jgi:hypothetical protein
VQEFRMKMTTTKAAGNESYHREVDHKQEACSRELDIVGAWE